MGYIKWVQSGEYLERYEYQRDLPTVRKPPKRRDRSDDGYSEIRRRYTTNINRSKRDFRRVVWANLHREEPPALFTLTLYQVLPLSASSRIFTHFAARLRRACGSEFRYIAVPEFQKRGAVHFHVLVWGLNHMACEGHWKYVGRGKKKYVCERTDGGCECATRYISRLWLRGFCDGIVTDGSPKLAGYLTKYMSKAMQDVRLCGEKAYYCSRNVMRPVSISASTRAEYKIEVIESQVIHSGDLLNEHEFDTLWLGRCYYSRYLIQGKKIIYGTKRRTGNSPISSRDSYTS